MSQSPQELPQGSGEAAPKKGKAKRIIILVALLLLIGGGGGGAYWFLTTNTDFSLASLFSGDDSEEEAVEGETEGQESTNNASSSESAGAAGTQVINTPTHLVTLPPLTINLADTGTSRYLRLGLDIEVSSKDAIAAIESQSAKIRDAIIILLSSKSYQSISTSEGKFQLKNEIASRINQILGTPRVVQIYFTDFVVQ